MAISNVSSSTVTATSTTASNTGAMAIVTTLFFMWGFITCLNDILIPHLKNIFDLNYAEGMLVQFAFFSGYFIFAFPAGKIVEWVGYKRTMVIGLLTMALGAWLFLPAASVPSFPFFLTALIIVAAGMTALQVSANAYVSVLGPADKASSRLNLTQAFNSLGTTVAPQFGKVLILGTAAVAIEAVRKMPPEQLHAYRLQEAASVKLPYTLIAVTLMLLALVIGLYKLPKIATLHDVADHGKNLGISIWKQRHLLLGVVGIFVYVGAEVSIGSFLVNYFSQPYIGGMTEKQAAGYVSFYWMFAMFGRFIGAAVLRKVKTGTLLGLVAVVACGLVISSMLSLGAVAMWTIILVGLFNSVMFPSIFTLGIAGLGPLTGEGSGLLIAAIVGGAIIPEIQGVLADHIGIHRAFIVPALCYCFIAYYGFRGSKPAGAVA
ncbi:MAG: sugar MFS transporter [Acidobacteriaceae bacterium]|nr:sugar MFS transporter [Acidobacteriaceae bacterium]